jgi:hypothetical protein
MRYKKEVNINNSNNLDYWCRYSILSSLNEFKSTIFSDYKCLLYKLLQLRFFIICAVGIPFEKMKSDILKKIETVSNEFF